jgi:hypothetical protein
MREGVCSQWPSPRALAEEAKAWCLFREACWQRTPASVPSKIRSHLRTGLASAEQR